MDGQNHDLLRQHLDPRSRKSLSVDPEKLSLKPGEEHEVIVSFSPKDPMGCEER